MVNLGWEGGKGLDKEAMANRIGVLGVGDVGGLRLLPSRYWKELISWNFEMERFACGL